MVVTAAVWAGFNNPLVRLSSFPNRRVLCYSSPKVLARESLCFRVLSVLVYTLFLVLYDMLS